MDEALSSGRMERVLATIALLISTAIAVAFPAGYFVLGLAVLEATLTAEAEINARIVTEHVGSSPELWRFQEERILIPLRRRPDDGQAEVRRVFDVEGIMVAESADPLEKPLLMRAEPIYDAGREVGRIEIVRSMRPLIVATVAAGAFGLLLAASVFLALRHLPLRALRQSHRELIEAQRRSLEISREKAQAEEANSAKSQFLAAMSHELRTPMNAVIGMTELLLQSRLDAGDRAKAGQIHRSALALLRILNDILDFSKIEAGRLELDASDFEVHALAQEVVDMLAAPAHEKGITISVRYSPDLPRWVRADAGRLQQILVNLVGNAVKFTERGGVALTVEAAPSGSAASRPGVRVLRFVVRDTGIGIDAQVRAKLFKPFSQGDGTMSRRFGGTGLGLAISHQLVTLMDGEIGVDSAPGEGSTFWFTLPVTPGETREEGPERKAEPARVPVAAGLPGGGLRALVVEDHPVNRLVAVAMLEQIGITVDIAVDGREAVDMWSAGEFDVVFMDCQMPGMDGFEATQAIRAREIPGKRIPIVALTANAMAGDRERCLEAGMDDYLAKPIQVAALEEVVRRQCPPR